MKVFFRTAAAVLGISILLCSCGVQGATGAPGTAQAGVQQSSRASRPNKKTQRILAEHEQVIQALFRDSAYKLSCDDLLAQLTEQSGNLEEESAIYTLKALMADYEAIPLKELDCQVPAFDLSAPDREQFLADLEVEFDKALDSYLAKAEMPAGTTEATVSVVLEEKDGQWRGILSTQSLVDLEDASAGMRQALFGKVVLDMEPTAIHPLALAEGKSQWLHSIFGSEAYSEVVQVTQVRPGDEGEYHVDISYPDPVAAYTALAKATAERYTEPVFESVVVNIATSGISDVLTGSMPYKQGTVTVALAEGAGWHEALDGDTIRAEVSAAKEKAQKELDGMLAEKAIPPVDLPQTSVLVGSSSGNDVILKTSSDTGNYYLQFYAISGTDLKASGTLTLGVFIRGGTQYTVRLPQGSYKLEYGTGDTWYGTSYQFGPSGSYNRLDSVIQSMNGYYNELTLYGVVDGNTTTTKLPYNPG